MGCCMATCGAWRPRSGVDHVDVIDELSKSIDTTVLSIESPDERGNGWPEGQMDGTTGRQEGTRREGLRLSDDYKGFEYSS